MLRRLLHWTHEVEQRVRFFYDLSAIPRPFFDHVDEGPDWHYVAMGLKAPDAGSAVVSVEVCFDETGWL